MTTAEPKLMSPEAVSQGQSRLVSIRDSLASIILGQQELIELCIIAIGARGHILLEGLPGLGKTELVKGLGRLLGLSFSRIQFTPDLLPGDITGGPILQEMDGRRDFVFQEGPLFGNFVLADEINRASPKTQSALLEAMQEQCVTVLGESHVLPSPFFVLATQNPIELEGTYPLPEAQLDRFLFKVEVPGLGTEALTEILETRRRGNPPSLDVICDADSLQELFACIDRVFLPKAVASYIARLVSASRPEHDSCPAHIKPLLRYGTSPRAAIAMAESGRAAALLAGRPNVDFKDIEKVAVAVMAHRLVLEHAARLEGISAREVVGKLLDSVDPLEQPLPKELA